MLLILQVGLFLGNYIRLEMVVLIEVGYFRNVILGEGRNHRGIIAHWLWMFISLG